MKMAGMKVVALALALVGPEPSPGPGIAWHNQATVRSDLQQRLTDAVGERSGVPRDQVISDAVPRAQRIVAREIDRDRAIELERLGRRLDEAGLDYRAGQFDRAQASLAELLNDLRADPLLPGASHMAWRAHVLEGQIAWTQGDPAAADSALREAVTLDPDATISTRKLPPQLVARYEAAKAEAAKTRDAWPTPTVELGRASMDPAIEIEIDGRPGPRPVPPGKHFVVVRRPGAQPVAGYLDATEPWPVPPAAPRLGAGLPVEAVSAERVCETAIVTRIVLARLRSGRLGLQAYACGKGYGAPWFGPVDHLDDGVRAVLAPRGGFTHERGMLASDRPWPASRTGGKKPNGPPPPPPKKPWYKRAWIWTLVGGAVVAGVTTGAVLGTRPDETGPIVNTDPFLNQ